jgi:hypothetical protein
MKVILPHGVDSPIQNRVKQLTLSRVALAPPDMIEMDLSSIDASSPLFFNMVHDKPLDLSSVPVISDRFAERRLGAIQWIMALNMWTMFNLAAIPLGSIYPVVPLTGSMKPWTSVPNPSVMALSVKILLLAVRIMDKFFAAGASKLSAQRCLNFNVWKDCEFTSAEDDMLLIYTSVCYVLACKMEMSESAPRMTEIYQLLQSWNASEGLLTGLSSLAEMVSGAKTTEVKEVGAVVLAKLYKAEVLVLQECEWRLGLITAMDVLDEVQRETCDDPTFLPLQSLAISTVIRMTLDARFVYHPACSATRLALCAMADAQLAVDVATPPTVSRHSRINKKLCVSDLSLEPQEDVGMSRIVVKQEDVGMSRIVVKQEDVGMQDSSLLSGAYGQCEMDPGLSDVVGCFLKKRKITRGGSE